MGPFSMVVMIVLIVMIANVLKVRAKYQGQRTIGADSGDTARLRSEVQQLRERIQVLERVITDNHSSVDLDRQIESLRDR